MDRAERWRRLGIRLFWFASVWFIVTSSIVVVFFPSYVSQGRTLLYLGYTPTIMTLLSIASFLADISLSLKEKK